MIVKMYYIDHKGQKDIAKLTGISQAKVSRLLAEARDLGMVQVKVGHYEPRNTELEEKVASRFGLKTVAVIRTWEKQQPEIHLKNIGYFGAPIVVEMIRPNNTICISAGRHIAYLVSEMAFQHVAGISVLQTMGSVGATVTDYDAIEVGRRFANKLGARFYQLQAPAIAATPQERDVFVGHDQIKSVLKMMKKAQMAIVGIGAPKDSIFLEKNFLKPKDIACLEEQKVVGEICGRFFNASGSQPQTKYKDCVIGITLEQLKKIPEVIGVTSGVHRAKAVTASIQAGLIKSLITDEETATALFEQGE